MNIDDILQLIVFCAIIFFPLGYLFHRRFPFWLSTLQSHILSPRYLKSAGIWTRKDLPSGKNRKS
ncbi:cellulose biosynthesis protein BcsF [Sodalis sp. dw_96]|uniref:cellulose biosynthesis protein BcsF n=1 Tax=Sodalis sp. dw_96 TaxID=2719794 RepID=UPI001BD21350|nr:cellulose biosynthesis protein BcsF [Sodalis sp. dw_96]